MLAFLSNSVDKLNGSMYAIFLFRADGTEEKCVPKGVLRLLNKYLLNVSCRMMFQEGAAILFGRRGQR